MIGNISFLLISVFCLHAVSQTIKNPTDKKKAPETTHEEVTITSKTLSYDFANRRAIFTGDVKVVNNDTTMTAELMSCYLDENDNLYLVIAEKNVLIVKGNYRATCQKAVYKINEEVVILRKQPKLFDGNNTITARIITFHEGTNTTEFDEVSGLFYKKDEDTADDKGL